jgi:hypothetical protein
MRNYQRPNGYDGAKCREGQEQTHHGKRERSRLC